MTERDKVLWTQVLLWRYAAYLRRSYWGYWREIKTRLKQELARIEWGRRLSPYEITLLVRRIRSMVGGLRPRVAQDMRRDLLELYEWERETTPGSPLLESVMVDGLSLSDSLDLFWSRLETGVAHTVGKVLVPWGSQDEVWEELGGVPVYASETPKPGELPSKWRVFEAFIAGAVAAVWNQAHRDQLVAASAGSGLVMTWDAIMDSRTCPVCVGLEGKSWNAETEMPIGHSIGFPGPLAHFRCRCTQTFGGESGAGDTWQTWLERQPNNLVSALAGLAVAKALKSGKKVTQEMFMEQWSNPLSIDEIEVIYERYLRD